MVKVKSEVLKLSKISYINFRKIAGVIKRLCAEANTQTLIQALEALKQWLSPLEHSFQRLANFGGFYFGKS